MNTELEVSPIGRLIPFKPLDGSSEASAYLADDLPDDLDLSPASWRSLIAANKAIARVDEASRRFASASILSSPAVWKEALSSSRIEGTEAAFTDVVASSLAPSLQTPASVEVTNYYRTYFDSHHHLDRYKEFTVNVFCQLQQQLLKRTDDDSDASGRLRTEHVVVGKNGPNLNNARFIPSPPGALLREAFERLVGRLNDRSGQLDPIAEIALVHYQFETLHPFHNGNGRLGRMLIGLQLKQFGLLERPLLAVSTWLNQRKTEYLDHLYQVSLTGDFEPWIRFFAEAIEKQSLATVEQIDALYAYLDELHKKAKALNYRGVVLDVIDGLLDHLAVTAFEISQDFSVSDKHARTLIGQLETIGALEFQPNTYPKLYLAKKAIDIVEGF